MCVRRDHILMSLRVNLSRVIVMSCVALLLSVVIAIISKPLNHANVVVPATRIAVLDSRRLKDEATCFKGHETLENMLSSVIAKMRDSEIKAKDDYERVKNDKALTKKQIAKSIEKIEENWAEISKQYKKEVEEIKKMDLKLSSLLQEKLDKVIEEISNKYKIDIVLNNQIKDTISTFYFTKNVDITNIVIKRLNHVISEVNLEKLR